jgi:ABC-2 type transport system permease protein
MKQFFSVLRFELAGYFRNKVYMGLTLVLVLIVAGVLTYPRIREAINGPVKEGGGETVQQAPQQGPLLALLNENTALTQEALDLFSASLPQYRLAAVEKDEQALRDDVAQGHYAGAIVIKSAQEAVYIVPNVGMYDDPGSVLQGALQAAYRMQSLKELGVPSQDISRILMPPVTVSVQNLGISQMENFFYTYALIFSLYMAIMIYGQLIATSVATEKSSRMMELLVTSARPNSLLFGKILGSGLAGLIQMTAIFGSAVLFFHINAASWAGNEIISSIFNMPLHIVGFALLFFVLGYFLYAFMFGAVGSLASRTEDVNTSSLPIILGFMVAFMVVVFSLASGNIDNPVMVFCSYLPLTSPMAMFTRIAMSSPAWYEIVLSSALLVVTTLLIGILAARIYRIGVLMYGKPPKPKELIRVLRAERRARA